MMNYAILRVIFCRDGTVLVRRIGVVMFSRSGTVANIQDLSQRPTKTSNERTLKPSIVLDPPPLSTILMDTSLPVRRDDFIITPLNGGPQDELDRSPLQTLPTAQSGGFEGAIFGFKRM